MVLCSAASLIACWSIFQEHGRINDDGVLYLESARQYALGEWKLGLGLYPWPLYPLLIAALHALTGLNLHHAALLLAAVFFVLSAHLLGLLIREAGGTRRTVMAGVLLLFSSVYIMRYTLPTVMREQGQWAFYLAALLYFLRFYRNSSWTDAFRWQACAIVATLFRIESITFLAGLPLVLLIQHQMAWPQRARRLFQAYALSMAATGGVALLLLGLPSLKLSDLGRLQEPARILQGAYQQITQGLMDKAHIIGDAVLGGFLSDYGMQGLLLTLVAVIVGKISAASGWLALLLAGLGVKAGMGAPDQEARRILLWTASLGLLNLWVILLCNFILPSRLAIPIAWIFFIFGAFTLTTLYDKWQRSAPIREHKLFWIALIVLALQLCVTLKPRPSHYNDEQDAVTWIKQNTPANSKVFYDNARFRYYAGLPFVDRGIADWDRVSKAIGDGSIKDYDYLVIHMDNRRPEKEKYLYQTLPHHLAATIKSSKNKRILIFVLKDDTHQ